MSLPSLNHWMSGLASCLSRQSVTKINDVDLSAPQGRPWVIISFQHTTLRDVFHTDLSAPLKQAREWIVIQFTMSRAFGHGPCHVLDSLVARVPLRTTERCLGQWGGDEEMGCGIQRPAYKANVKRKKKRKARAIQQRVSS